MSTKQFDIEHDHALVIITAKERGLVYRLRNGELALVSMVEEHPPSYSDNEGFFFRNAAGIELGSGNVREKDGYYDRRRYLGSLSSEVKPLIEEETPDALFIIEPEHFKGEVEEHLSHPNNLPVRTIKYGNHVGAAPHDVMHLLEGVLNEAHDPTDPASVAGEANAEEKRKILETGKKVTG